MSSTRSNATTTKSSASYVDTRNACSDMSASSMNKTILAGHFHQLFHVLDEKGIGKITKERVLKSEGVIWDAQKLLGDNDDTSTFVDIFMKKIRKAESGPIDVTKFIDIAINALDEADTNNRSFFEMVQRAMSVLLFKDRQTRGSITNVQGNDRLIHPNSIFQCCWTGIVALIFLVVWITVPLVIAWPILAERMSPMHIIFDMILGIDVAKNFYTGGYIDANDEIVLDKLRVRQWYYKNDLFWDCAIAFPVDLLLLVPLLKENTTTFTVLTVMRLFKTFNIRRVLSFMTTVEWYFGKIEEQVQFYISDGMIKLLYLFASLCIWAHYTGCVQFLLARLFDFPEDCWVVRAMLIEETVFQQWVWSFYKSLSQMILIGFESPPLVNTTCETMSRWCQLEMWTTLTIGLFPGAVFFSLLIAAITRVVETNNLKNIHFEERFHNLSGFLRHEGLSERIQRTIIDDFSHRNPKGHYYNEHDAMADIGPQRESIIRHHRASQLATCCNIFSGKKNRDFLRAMCRVMERVSYREFEDIIDNEITGHGDYIYFISSGMVSLFRDGSEDPFCTLYTGDSFGYEGLYQYSLCLIARASSAAYLFRITRGDWLCLTETFPALNSVWEGFSDIRYNLVQQEINFAGQSASP